MKDKIIVIIFIVAVALLYFYDVIDTIIIMSALFGAVVVELYKLLKKDKNIGKNQK